MFDVGMQVATHDIKDEGVDTVMGNMQTLGNVHTVYVMCNYWTGERQPYPKGELPHNPKRKVYYPTGGLYFDPHPRFYKKSILKPVRTPEPDFKDFDVLKAATVSARERRMRVLAWVMALREYIADKYQKYTMVDVYGRRASGYLCPSNPEVSGYVVSLIQDIIHNYSVDGIFLDRFRFPEWAGPGKGFDPAFTCFCKKCLKRAKRDGIDISRIRKSMRRTAEIVKSDKISSILSRFLTYRKGSLDLVETLVGLPELVEWINFRQDVTTDFVSRIYESIKDTNPKLELSLDLWPPSYSWLLGQNYRKLRKCCDSLKYFTYHRLGGGVDIKAVVEELKRLNPSLQVSPFLDLFYRFFGFSGPRELDELGEKGFTIDFVLEETLKALEETGKEVKVYPGVQIWDLTPAEVKETVAKSLEADVDGIIGLCYGWAPLENIESFGNAVRELR